jgi:hypothetical protein
MAKKRARISDGATFEELQAFLFKLAWQLRAMEPPGQDLDMLEWIKTEMALSVSGVLEGSVPSK